MQSSTNPPKTKVVVYGGSFDPPHNGHIQLFSQLHSLNLGEELMIIPCASRADKNFLLSDEERLCVLNDLFGKLPGVTISRKQIDRGSMIPTYELIKSFEKQHPNKQFYFVIGSDLLRELHTWRSAQQLKSEINFIIVNRKGYPIEVKQLPVHYRIVDIAPMKVSSTEVNSIIRDGSLGQNEKRGRLEGLISNQVIDLLAKKKLL